MAERAEPCGRSEGGGPRGRRKKGVACIHPRAGTAVGARPACVLRVRAEALASAAVGPGDAVGSEAAAAEAALVEREHRERGFVGADGFGQRRRDQAAFERDRNLHRAPLSGCGGESEWLILRALCGKGGRGRGGFLPVLVAGRKDEERTFCRRMLPRSRSATPTLSLASPSYLHTQSTTGTHETLDAFADERLAGQTSSVNPSWSRNLDIRRQQH
eukprot:124420-Rhodomonas_salina.3